MEDRLVWEDDLIENPPVASAQAVMAVESALRVRLPKDYLAVATAHQGASPSVYCLEAEGVETAMDYLFHFEDEPASTTMINAYRKSLCVPEGVVPFAAALNGYLCFDYRKSPENPPVVACLYEHSPPAVRYVAESFDAMVSMLMPFE